MALKIDYDALLDKSVFNSWEEITEFASTVRLKFPKGMMGDGVTPWRCNKMDIAKKLLRFFEEYGYSYTKEQIIAATDKYIEDHKYNNHFGMRNSKYFIWKLLPTGEPVSELATVLEAIEDGDTSSVDNSNSWLNELK